MQVIPRAVFLDNVALLRDRRHCRLCHASGRISTYFHFGFVAFGDDGAFLLRHAARSRGRCSTSAWTRFVAHNRVRYVTLLRPQEAIGGGCESGLTAAARLARRVHRGGVVFHQLLGDAAGIEIPLPAISDTAVTSAAVPVMKHSEKLGSSSGMMRRSITSKPRLLRQRDHGLPRDAVEEAVGDRRVDLAVLDEEDVGAGAFGDAALPVEHHGVGIAFALGAVLGDGADHVEAGRLGEARRASSDRAGDIRRGRA